MSGFTAPIDNFRPNVSSTFGRRKAPRTSGGRGSSMHKGLDIRMPRGTPFKAAKDGEVVFSGWARGYGKTVVVKHNDGTFTKYAHADSLNATKGQKVKAGEVIGKVGRTGNTSGDHLHFEVRQGDPWNGKALDPLPLLQNAAPGADPKAAAAGGACNCGDHGRDRQSGGTPAGGAPSGGAAPEQSGAPPADPLSPPQRARRRGRVGRAAAKGAGKAGGARRRSQLAPMRPDRMAGAPSQGAQPAANGGGNAGPLREKLARLGVDAAFLKQMSEKYGVPESLILAVIQQESGGNPNARSPVGAAGLMQLMPATARELGVTDRNDPRQNVEGGAKYLGRMLRAFKGNTALALAAYNAGPRKVRKYGGVPPFAETRKYVAVVQRNAEAYA